MKDLKEIVKEEISKVLKEKSYHQVLLNEGIIPNYIKKQSN